jgi:D-alanyl-D-alanine carboxypeptidase
MRSGLYNYTSARNLRKASTATRPGFGRQRNYSPSRSSIRQIFAPGEEYDYCNTNYALLGLIAEKIEGAPLARIFQDRFFGPLNMKSTLLPASTSSAIPEPYSPGYLYGSSSYTLADAPYPADLIAAARAGTLKPNDDTDQNPSYAFAAGGAISTADDLAIWMRALVGGKIFNPDYQHQWLESPEPQDPSNLTARSMGMGYR